MRLGLFSSKGDSSLLPNLVSLQHPLLTGLPTVLVCPVLPRLALTPLRVEIAWDGETFVVACDLIRPIHRQILRPVGEIDDQTSARILETFARILAR
jgi:mRNA-degrading endonuclease toxin of MazEF toxin-antitoxin module